MLTHSLVYSLICSFPCSLAHFLSNSPALPCLIVGPGGWGLNKMNQGENYQKFLKWRGGGHSFATIMHGRVTIYSRTHSLSFCYFSGQICFCLFNLEPIPCAVELKKVPKREMLAAITEMITKGVIPKQNQIYREKHETAWFHLLQAGKASIKIDLWRKTFCKSIARYALQHIGVLYLSSTKSSRFCS